MPSCREVGILALSPETSAGDRGTVPIRAKPGGGGWHRAGARGGLVFGQSYAVLVCSLAGALLWHIVVRPVEESDLNSRFGDADNEYARRVNPWIPTFGQNAIQMMNPVERECR